MLLFQVPSNCRSTPALTRRSSLSSSLTRSGSTASRASGFSAARGTASTALPTATQPAPSVFEEDEDDDDASLTEGREVKVLFSFEATSEFEISVQEGEIVRVVEEDDGSSVWCAFFWRVVFGNV